MLVKMTLRLRWDGFEGELSSGLRQLFENNELFDVTLNCQGHQLKAHKNVLSVCSPYFKEYFKENPGDNVTIDLHDVKLSHLQALLHFMYHGEVSVYQRDLSAFLKTADGLQIRGLAESDKDPDCINNEEETEVMLTDESSCHDEWPDGVALAQLLQVEETFERDAAIGNVEITVVTTATQPTNVLDLSASPSLLPPNNSNPEQAEAPDETSTSSARGSKRSGSASNSQGSSEDQGDEAQRMAKKKKKLRSVQQDYQEASTSGTQRFSEIKPPDYTIDQKLENVLKEWGYEDLIPKFQDCGIDMAAMMSMSQEALQELVPGRGPYLGFLIMRQELQNAGQQPPYNQYLQYDGPRGETRIILRPVSRVQEMPKLQVAGQPMFRPNIVGEEEPLRNDHRHDDDNLRGNNFAPPRVITRPGVVRRRPPRMWTSRPLSNMTGLIMNTAPPMNRGPSYFSVPVPVQEVNRPPRFACHFPPVPQPAPTSYNTLLRVDSLDPPAPQQGGSSTTGTVTTNWPGQRRIRLRNDDDDPWSEAPNLDPNRDEWDVHTSSVHRRYAHPEQNTNDSAAAERNPALRPACPRGISSLRRHLLASVDNDFHIPNFGVRRNSSSMRRSTNTVNRTPAHQATMTVSGVITSTQGAQQVPSTSVNSSDSQALSMLATLATSANTSSGQTCPFESTSTAGQSTSTQSTAGQSTLSQSTAGQSTSTQSIAGQSNFNSSTQSNSVPSTQLNSDPPTSTQPNSDPPTLTQPNSDPSTQPNFTSSASAQSSSDPITEPNSGPSTLNQLDSSPSSHQSNYTNSTCQSNGTFLSSTLLGSDGCTFQSNSSPSTSSQSVRSTSTQSTSAQPTSFLPMPGCSHADQSTVTVVVTSNPDQSTNVSLSDNNRQVSNQLTSDQSTSAVATSNLGTNPYQLNQVPLSTPSSAASSSNRMTAPYPVNNTQLPTRNYQVPANQASSTQSAGYSRSNVNAQHDSGRMWTPFGCVINTTPMTSRTNYNDPYERPTINLYPPRRRANNNLNEYFEMINFRNMQQNDVVRNPNHRPLRRVVMPPGYDVRAPRNGPPAGMIDMEDVQQPNRLDDEIPFFNNFSDV